MQFPAEDQGFNTTPVLPDPGSVWHCLEPGVRVIPVPGGETGFPFQAVAHKGYLIKWGTIGNQIWREILNKFLNINTIHI